MNRGGSASPPFPSIAEVSEIRPSHVQVDLGAIERNLRAVQDHVGTARVMPILKANAYGHGLIAVARKLDKLGFRGFGVGFLEEAVLLRSDGISSPILVLGAPDLRQLPMFLDYDLTITVPSLESLRQVEAVAHAQGVTARVHLKVDTGMGRLGVHYSQAEALLEGAERSSCIEVEGIYSHLANGDSADLSSARTQLDRFSEVCSFYDHNSLQMPVRHIANSGGILQLPESHLDLVRPGIMTYGVYPSEEASRTVPLEPALGLTSRLVFSKLLPPGHPVSYGSTWHSSTETRVVTIPMGYGDGYLRAMSGSAEVLIRNKRYPTVGRICMDQFVVDVGSDEASSGDEVVLIGGSGAEEISVEHLARWAGTIPYEVLTNINARVPRVYIDA